ncbi:MAG: hypothetical protein AAFX08_09965 [Pseudomonadota bacterium]
MLSEIIGIIAYRDPDDLLWVAPGLIATFSLIYYLKGRAWAFVYVALIPFLNWSFGNVESYVLAEPNDTFEKGVKLNPLTMVTGMVFVIRDFVQREMGHRVLLVMALAVAWAFYYAWPVIAIASGLAFAVSEAVDWVLFTFTKYRLSTRVLISSAAASPIDTTIFLYGAGLARKLHAEDQRAEIMQQMANAAPAELQAALAEVPPVEVSDELHWANWIVFVLGKMVGAVVVSWMIKRREDRGEISPHAA